MKKLVFGAAIFFAAIANPIDATAEAVLSGNDIYTICSDQSEQNRAICGFYIIGLIEGARLGVAMTLNALGKTSVEETNEITDYSLGFCHPEGADYFQYQAIFLKYLNERPEIRHQTARLILISALGEAFPCIE